jgi:periplasmic divalent cation tolerance protein
MSGSAHSAPARRGGDSAAERSRPEAARPELRAPAPTDVRVILMTVPSVEVATELVRKLVDERLAACGNVIPGLTSIYRWHGAVQTDSEVLVILKATTDSVPALLVRAPELHPYDVPEILVLPVTEGYRPYLEWVRGSGSDGAEG